jgi:integrase/recombinase XerD
VTFVGTKSGKSRRVPLTARAVAVLKVLQKARVKKMSGESPVFPAISGNMLDRHFHKAAKKAGLGRDVTPHSLRHGYAVALTMRGVPFSVSCELLGHSTPAFTATRYARWVPDGAAARAVAALSESRSAPAAAAKSA